MNEALELIRIVEARGGQIRIDGGDLVIVPREAALPLMDSLRTYKPAILALLQSGEQQADPELDSNVVPGEWMLDRCVFRDRCVGGVGALHVDLARWNASHARPAPPSRREFERALQAEGFSVSDGFVCGLVLREDIEQHARVEAVAAQSTESPARVTVARRRTAQRRKT